MNPNRSLDTPSPFLIGKVRLSGILPASVRILILAAISPKSNDRFGMKGSLEDSVLGGECTFLAAC